MYDIVIVGSGPAGSTLARLISDKFSVLLLDKRDLENETANPLSKCCGGLLAPDAQKMMAQLGLGIPVNILVEPQPFAVRTIDLTNNLERLYQRFYFNMDRDKFDRWLVSILPPQVDKKFNATFKSFVEVPDGYIVKYIHHGKEMTAKTRVIVGADGAFSKIRSLINTGISNPEMYISIQEWFKGEDYSPYFTAIFDEDISDFYSWIIPKQNFLLLGSALRPRDNTWEKYNLLKTKLRQHGLKLDNIAKTEGAFINRTKRLSQLYVGRDKIVLVGEAAGAISPSSAEGISYALKSALYLAQSLDEGLDGFLPRYRQKVMSIKLNILLKNLKSPAMYNPLLRKLAMKSGLQSIK